MVADDFYKANGKPIVAPSFCLVADLLGLKHRVRSCNTEEASNELCQQIYGLLSKFKEDVEVDEIWHPWSYVQFSDTVVLGYPIIRAGSFGEPELGDAIEFIAQFQLSMTRGGFLVRGGLSFGELHISNDHCFGKALVVAHELEKTHATPPRIVASPQVRKLVEQHIGFYSDPGQAPQVNAILKDVQDDVLFINYLDWLNIGEGTDLKWLEDHKTFLLSQQEKHAEDAAVKEKLDWVVAYHNFFCMDQVVGNDDWEPSWEEKRSLTIGDGKDNRDRFRRLAERSSIHVTGKCRMPGQYEWPPFDE